MQAAKHSGHILISITVCTVPPTGLTVMRQDGCLKYTAGGLSTQISDVHTNSKSKILFATSDHHSFGGIEAAGLYGPGVTPRAALQPWVWFV